MQKQNFVRNWYSSFRWKVWLMTLESWQKLSLFVVTLGAPSNMQLFQCSLSIISLKRQEKRFRGYENKKLVKILTKHFIWSEISAWANWVMDTEKPLANNRSYICSVSRCFHVPNIYNFVVIHPWNLWLPSYPTFNTFCCDF